MALGEADLQEGSEDEEIGGKGKYGGGDDIRDKQEIEHSLVAFLHITGRFDKGGRSQKKSSMTSFQQKFKVNVLLVTMVEFTKPPKYDAATRLAHNHGDVAWE